MLITLYDVYHFLLIHCHMNGYIYEQIMGQFDTDNQYDSRISRASEYTLSGGKHYGSAG